MFAEIKIDDAWKKVGAEFKSTHPELEATDRVYDQIDNNLLMWLTYDIDPDGMPEDASEEIKNHKYLSNKKIYCFTLDELLGLDTWDTEIFDSFGYISEWQYKQLKEKGIKPVNIRSNVYLKDAEKVMPFEMDMIMRFPKLRTAASYFVQYNYEQVALRSKFEFFCGTSIPRLIELIPDGGTAKDVRIIFGR